MKLPPYLRFRNTVHGSGRAGMCFYVDEDCSDLGILHEARRESSGHPMVGTWRFRWLPDREFTGFAELAGALVEQGELFGEAA